MIGFLYKAGILQLHYLCSNAKRDERMGRHPFMSLKHIFFLKWGEMLLAPPQTLNTYIFDAYFQFLFTNVVCNEMIP